MVALVIPQPTLTRTITNYIASHLPALPSITGRLPPLPAASSSRAVEESTHNAEYDAPPTTFASLLAELFPPFLLAVPKSKISHSRKSMRSANKGLKNKTNINLCPACGSPKLMHHLCPKCYSQITRRWKDESRSTLAQQPASTTTTRPEQEV
ncbi:hypothetical protein NCC49_006309 [Naganishia albida]|nr:hypothetical protein NCC49_006309 [Naganishia albida]